MFVKKSMAIYHKIEHLFLYTFEHMFYYFGNVRNKRKELQKKGKNNRRNVKIDFRGVFKKRLDK